MATIYLAEVFLGERMTLQQIGGSLLVLMGVIAVGVNSRKAR